MYIPDLAALAARFKNPRISGFKAQCPVCGQDSLRISFHPHVPDAIGVKCFTGCGRETILSKTGIRAAELYPQIDTPIAPATPITPATSPEVNREHN